MGNGYIWKEQVVIKILIKINSIPNQNTDWEYYLGGIKQGIHFCPFSAKIELSTRSMFNSVEKDLQVRITEKSLAVN